MAGETDSEVVRLAARHHDPDRYFAALLATAAARPHLLAIAAFYGEVMHVPFAISEPMIGRIRLQWWREAIERTGEPAGHPVADAVRAAGIEAPQLMGMITAAEMLIDQPPFPAEPDLFAFLDKGSSTAFRAAALALGVSLSSDLEAAARSAGRAHGIATLLDLIAWRPELRDRFLPMTMANRAGSTEKAIAELAQIAGEARIEAITSIARLPASARPAFLPLATVPLSLRTGKGGPPSRLSRIWCIGRAAMLGSLSR